MSQSLNTQNNHSNNNKVVNKFLKIILLLLNPQRFPFRKIILIVIFLVLNLLFLINYTLDIKSFSYDELLNKAKVGNSLGSYEGNLFKQNNLKYKFQPNDLNQLNGRNQYDLTTQEQIFLTFNQYKQKYQKIYINKEEQIFRSIIYRRNLQTINIHNKKNNRTYNMGLNQFTHLTAIEFASIYTRTFVADQHIQIFTQKLIKNKPKQGQTQNQKVQLSPDEINYIKTHNSKQLKQRDVQINSKYSYSIFNQIGANKQKIQDQQKRIHQMLDYLKKSKTTQLATKSPKHKRLGSVLFQFRLSQGLTQSISNNQTHLNSEINNNLTKKQTNKLTNSENSTQHLSLSQIERQKLFTWSSANLTDKLIDWTKQAGKIRSQGFCGACYVFATADTVASLYSIYKYGLFLPLSTQQVVDCADNEYAYGCSGGYLEGSLFYIRDKGLEPNFKYPFVSELIAAQIQNCKKNGGPFKISSFNYLPIGECSALLKQLIYGPVAVAVTGYFLHNYKNGIFNDCNRIMDHAVVLIGYKSGIGWKIKNSWGIGWGLNGFAWISQSNNCGVCNTAMSIRL